MLLELLTAVIFVLIVIVTVQLLREILTVVFIALLIMCVLKYVNGGIKVDVQYNPGAYYTPAVK